MENEYILNYPIQTVYRVIANLVVDNANVRVEDKYTYEDLASIDYTYDIQAKKAVLKNYVKVVEVDEPNRIAYTIRRQMHETYLVKFDLTELPENQTQLNYGYDIQTEKASTATNFALLSYFYKRRQKKGFHQMMEYLETKCEELEKGNHHE